MQNSSEQSVTSAMLRRSVIPGATESWILPLLPPSEQVHVKMENELPPAVFHIEKEPIT
jgi:hypothetical protein